jgi:hypothetical protein
MKRTLIALLALAAFAVAGVAYARDEPRRQGDFNVFLKGGIGGYTGNLNPYSAAGPTWGVVADLQPWRSIGLELAYEGSRNMVTDPRVTSASLSRNGADALLKLSPPFVERIKPFVGAGLGASYVTVGGNGNGLYRNDMMEEIPLATGIEFNSGSVTAGLRGTFRFLIDQQMAASVNGGGGMADVSAALGARF